MKTEIILLEAFGGLLTGKQLIQVGAISLKIPIVIPLGRFIFDEDKFYDQFPGAKIATFKWMGKCDGFDVKIFELVEIV